MPPKFCVSELLFVTIELKNWSVLQYFLIVYIIKNANHMERQLYEDFSEHLIICIIYREGRKEID